MRTFFGKPLARRPAPERRASAIGGWTAAAHSEHGFLLIEVLVSTLLVGLMVVASITGFTALTRTSSDERQHDEAALLAAQSQQQLRSDPASTLLAFANGEKSYEATVAGTTYTIVQKASFGNGSSTTGCSATETTKGQGTYILVSSTVTWAHMVGPAVTESSLITPPTGSALLVEVSSGEVPTSGIPIVVKYIPSGTSSSTSIEQTTGATGCVLFAGIPATEATVEVKETQGIVNKYGTQSWPPQTVTLAPNILTHAPTIKLAPGGAITASFTYEGATSYTHKNNAQTANVVEAVTGDTFVAFNVEMAQAPEFEKGNTIKPTPFTAGLFEVAPGAPGSYAETAESPTEPVRYPRGNLFPFPAGKAWTAYAGDCTANKPETFDASVKSETVSLKPGEDATLKMPMTYVLLDVYSKSQAEIKAMKEKSEATWPALETTNGWLTTLTDVKCSGVKPNNETVDNIKHTQYTSLGGERGGHLSAPFLPFGEYELCLATGTKSYKLKKPFVNKNPAEPVSLNIYLNELTQSEKETARTSKEAETRKAREASEKAVREAREATEASTRAARVKAEGETKAAREASEKPAREAREAAEKKEKETKTSEENTKKERLANEKKEKEAWESEVNKNKKSKAEKEKEDKEKEKTQETKRKTAETTEKAAETKRKEEETGTQTTRTKEEASKASAESSEATSKTAAETKENESKTAAVTKETKAKEAEETKEAEAKAAAITKEEAELSEKENIVETGNKC